MDTSGSMPYLPAANGPEPENIPANPNESRWGRLKVAADQFLTLLATFGAGVGRFGVSMFPDITQPEYPPSPAVSAADFHAPTNIESAEITAAQGSLDDHTPSPGGGATSMGQGIAYVIGSTTLGNFENTSEAIEYNRRWMVLMSDGAHNSGPPDPPEFYRTAEGGVSCPDPGTAAAGQSFMDKEIGVITVAYGDETGTPFEVDHDLLETLACKSGGIALNAGINDVDDVDDLAKAFREAVTEGLNLEIPADPGGLLRAAASEVRPQVVITPYDTKAAFVVDWDTFDEERVRVQLLTPTCELITPETAQTDPNVTYHSHPRYKVYAVD
ncbi:MAG: VWA domain-containing protein, partial [bacterium]|nr:VWA domain-containing protein [bacterium]